MSEQEPIRPDQQLTLVFRKDVLPKVFVKTALDVRTAYAEGLSFEAKQQVQEDETGLILKRIDKLEEEQSDKIEAGVTMVFVAPADANPEILKGIREKYSKKNA